MTCPLIGSFFFNSLSWSTHLAVQIYYPVKNCSAEEVARHLTLVGIRLNSDSFCPFDLKFYHFYVNHVESLNPSLFVCNTCLLMKMQCIQHYVMSNNMQFHYQTTFTKHKRIMKFEIEWPK